MKRYVMLALVALFTLSLSLQAQDRPQRGQFQMATAKERAERMAKQLELNDAEKAKVQALFEKQDKKREEMRAEIQKIREEKKEANGDLRAKFEEERKASDAELESIIGKEKFEKYQKARAEREARFQERRGDRPNNGGPRPE